MRESLTNSIPMTRLRTRRLAATNRIFVLGAISLITCSVMQCSAFSPRSLSSFIRSTRREPFLGKDRSWVSVLGIASQRASPLRLGMKAQRVRDNARDRIRSRRSGPNTSAEGYTAEAFVKMRHEVAYQVAERSKARKEKNFSLTGGLDSCPCLVLNADYQPLSYLPLSLWGWQDVIKAVFMDKVTVVATYSNRSIRSSRMEVQLPSVIALKEFVNNHKSRPPFTRRNLFLRDSHKCQYCLKYFPPRDLSFDHVIPKKLGGKGTWENVVTACAKCNNRKSDCHPRDLRSIGMHLAQYPRVPTFHELQHAARKYPPRHIHETWEEFLYFESEISAEDWEAESSPQVKARALKKNKDDRATTT